MSRGVDVTRALNWVAYEHELPHPRAVLDCLQEQWGWMSLAEIANQFDWGPSDWFNYPDDYWPREIYFDVASGYLHEPPHHHPNCDCGTCCDGSDEYEEPVPAVLVDEDGHDDWTGLPTIPNPPPGRCRFGIEIEFNSGNRGGIVNGLMTSGLACRDMGYTHEIVRYWKLTTDSTVTGGELVSPIMDGSDAAIEEVKEAIRIVKANGGRPSTRDHPQGMHVHMDVSEFRTRHLLALSHNLQRGQHFLAAYVPPSRLTDYNRLLSSREWDALNTWLGVVDVTLRTHGRGSDGCPVGRGVDFNFNPLLSYGTVEFRLLGSTLNTLRVSTWIRVLQTFIEASRNCARMPEGQIPILEWLQSFGLENEHIERFRSVVTERGNQARLIAA